MNSKSKMMPLNEAQKLLTDLDADTQRLVEGLPEKITEIVRDHCGDELSEDELAEIESALDDWRNRTTAALSGQLEKSRNNLSKKQ